MSSNIRLTRRCHVCGVSFVAKTTVTKNCSDRCAKKAYKLKIKNQKVYASESETSSQIPYVAIEISAKSYLSIKEAALLYGVSEKTIRRKIARKEMPIIRFSKRIVLIKKEFENLLRIET
ncbi:helix-turn-helix domain-containing protein [Rufibacter tibetensis]|uniref:Helix-turn-helix domain-containing protein n=1 Tax=Rufibacter tibetensis TaxID=512763 RepID=A0A0P0CAL8_9BACT|nr:helix-turn-helix domain-containing protein [Rufibacter tibetensis]ALJ00680.1 hypothetical protein DC20_18980 [Rufibacter tibetensis]